MQMAPVKGTRLYFLIVGATEMTLSLAFVVCSKILLGKYSNVSGVQAFSLLYLYFAIPGIFCILAGTTRKPFYVTASIVFNVISIILSTIGAAISSVFWHMYREKDACRDVGEGKCICFQNTYSISCADGDVSRHILAVLTVASILTIMTSFLGCILGCTKACCDPLSAEQHISRIETSQSEQTIITCSTAHNHETTVCHAGIELKTIKETTVQENCGQVQEEASL